MLLGARVVRAQQPVTLRTATDSALARGSRVALGRTDTLAAAALVTMARAWQNPALSASYTRDDPRYHVSLEVPLDLPHIRRLRAQAARATRDATLAELDLTRALVRHDVRNAYAGALAASGRAGLSREARTGAARLLGMVRARRDEGDASEMDVELAEVESALSESASDADSLTAMSAVLALQLLMGLPAEQVTIELTDSLSSLVAMGDRSPSGMPGGDSLTARESSRAPAAAVGATARVREPLPVAAAAATLRAREREVELARRRRALVPSLLIGADLPALAGDSARLLPVLGVSVPLPLFNRYGGDIAFARAQRDRAAIELRAARLESAADLARARATRDVAIERVRRGEAAASTARRVAAKALTAYAEGEAALPFVLQAQRSARETLAQLLDALAGASSAQGAIRLLTSERSAP